MKQKQKIIEVYFIGETPCEEISFMNLSISPIKSEKCNHEHKNYFSFHQSHDMFTQSISYCVALGGPPDTVFPTNHEIMEEPVTGFRHPTADLRTLCSVVHGERFIFSQSSVETNFLLGLTERVDATRQMNFPITPILDRGWQPSKSRSHMQLSHLYFCFSVFVIGDKCEYLH